MFAAMPEVDRVLGNIEKLDATALVERGSGERTSPSPTSWRCVRRAMTPIEGIEGRARAIVQVQNGCDHRCTFCVIPFGRGNSRSVPMADVVAQVRKLAANGYREIVLTGVDITSYGEHLPDTPKLGALVKRDSQRRAGDRAAAAVVHQFGRSRCRSARCVCQ